MWPGTTADLERELPKPVMDSLTPLLVQPWGEAAIDHFFAVEATVDELLGSCAGLPLSYAVRRLMDVLRSNGLPPFDINQLPIDTDADELLVAVSEIIGAWRQLYLDPEKMLGHLVLDHGLEMSGDLGADRMDRMHRSHRPLHGGHDA